MAKSRFSFNLRNLIPQFGRESCIGLSIGTASIKLVEIQKSRKGWSLLNFGIVPLPEDAIVNREIVNSVAVIEKIKSLTDRIKLRSKSVCTSISGNALIIKRMNLEVPNLRELQDQVFWEAEQYLPFDVSEVVLDYQVLSRAKDNKTDILMVAVKRSVLDSYMGCIEEAGLKPKIVDVDFFALQNIFEANYPVNAAEAVAIVDVGASAVKIVVVHNGIPVFTKDASIGGRNLTADIQQHMSLSFEDAETLKVGGKDGATPVEVSELTHAMAENIGSELSRTLEFYNASATSAPVSYILLAGGSAKIQGLSKIVEDLAGLPTQLINPFNAISYDPSIFTPEHANAISSVAAVPMGLALRAGAK